MKILLLIPLFIVYSCATSKKSLENATENIDIKNLDQDLSAKTIDSKAQKNIFPEDAAFNWQKLFKGAPNSKERPILQQSIKQLTNATNSDELMRRGRNEFSLGLLAASEATFRQILRKDPKNVDALIDLASTLSRQRRVTPALEILSEAKAQLASQEKPNESQVFKFRYVLAMTYLTGDDRTKAHSILSDLIGKDSKFVPGYAALAFSYLKDGKDSVAKFIVEQAQDRGGDHPSLYNLMGIISERQGKRAAAKELYNKALSINDLYGPALVNRGNIYLTDHELDLAERDYNKALDSEPSNTDAMIGLGVVQRQTGRYKLSKNTFERVIEIESDHPQARFNLGLLLRENLKNDGEALRYFSEVTQSERANQGLKSLAKAAIEEMHRL